MNIIDPPSPFAMLEEWENFLAQLKKLEPSNDVIEQIRIAKEMIEEKQKTGN